MKEMNRRPCREKVPGEASVENDRREMEDRNFMKPETAEKSCK